MDEEDQDRLNSDTTHSLEEIKKQMMEAREENDPDKRDSMLKSAWQGMVGLAIRLHAFATKNGGANSNNLL